MRTVNWPGFLARRSSLGRIRRFSSMPAERGRYRWSRPLPERRRQVLELMSRGLLNKQIAWELKISEKTVKMHRGLLLEQLGVLTSADAIRIAVEAGL